MSTQVPQSSREDIATLIPPSGEHGGAVLYASLLLLAWATWRLWKFTLFPAFHPEYPREFPYAVPFLGHALSFFGNSNSLLSKARATVGKKQEPFSLSALGTTFHIITDVRHITEVYKNTDSLSFDEFSRDYMKATGLSEAAVDATFARSLPRDKEGFPNPKGLPFGSLVRQMHLHQLSPGENLQALECRLLAWFNHRLRIEELQKDSRTDSVIEVPLYRWCAEFFTRAGEHIFFGDGLSAKYPDLPSVFFTYDELCWQVLYQYPTIFAKRLTSAKRYLHSALKEYFQAPTNQRTGSAWFTRAAENELRALGLSDDDIAVYFLVLYFVANTNTHKFLFWLLTYLLHRPSLIEVVRAETAGAFDGEDLVNPEHVTRQGSCPTFEAICLETLRLSGNSSSVRCVNNDTVIGRKLLKKGTKLLIPYRVLHFDQSVYGADVNTFRPERFLQKPNHTMVSNCRPYGGGKTICTGRYLAEHSVKMCAAMILRRYDLDMVGNPPLPEGDEAKPGFGIISIKEGHDFTVIMSKRDTI